MGYKSSMAITREDALAEIARMVPNVDDKILAHALEVFADQPNSDLWGYNFMIIDAYANADESIAVFRSRDEV